MKKKKKTLNELQFNHSECIVVDIGSGRFKIGFAGEDQPRFVFRSCQHINKENDSIRFYGDECFNKDFSYSGKYKELNFAITNEEVNFSIVQSILDYLFTNKLKLEQSTDSYSIIIAEPCECKDEYRVKMAKMLFDVFKFPKLYFGYQPVCAMFSQGTTSGLTVDIGENFTQIVPLYKGFALKHAIVKHNLGGRDLTLWLKKLLQKKYSEEKESPIKVHTIKGYQYLETLKEKICRVSYNYKKDKENKEIKTKYILPDRTVIEADSALIFGVPEVLFNPTIIGKKIPGIHEMIYKSYCKCDENMKQMIEGNIVLAGGSSMFKGMKKRLEKELAGIFRDNRMQIKVPDESNLNCWVGASMLASFEAFSSLCVKKTHFDEDKDKKNIFKNIF